MPSGAKKRKAAKKKLQKEAHNYFDGSHSLGTETAKSHEERESDKGDVERETSEEPVVNNYGDVKEVSLNEQSVVEFPKEEKLEENYNDVLVNIEGDDVKKTENGGHKRSSSSSSSSSSEDDEVAVEKEKPVEVEASSSLVEVEESIPVQECVKEVVSFPNELKNENENESEVVENLVVSSIVESEMKQNLDEVIPSADEKENVPLKVTNVVEEKMETKAKEFETHKYVEEQPLISSTPLPVRQTSWTNCCGLFEVFSGGASR